MWCGIIYVTTDTLQAKQNPLSYHTARRPGCGHCNLCMVIKCAALSLMAYMYPHLSHLQVRAAESVKLYSHSCTHQQSTNNL